jgi:hypothetical protein
LQYEKEIRMKNWKAWCCKTLKQKRSTLQCLFQSLCDSIENLINRYNFPIFSIYVHFFCSFQ